jgi:hypothetical protein
MLSQEIAHALGFATVFLNGTVILDQKINTFALDEIRLEAARHFLLERGIAKEDRQYWSAVSKCTEVGNLWTNPKRNMVRHG